MTIEAEEQARHDAQCPLTVEQAEAMTTLDCCCIGCRPGCSLCYCQHLVIQREAVLLAADARKRLADRGLSPR